MSNRAGLSSSRGDPGTIGLVVATEGRMFGEALAALFSTQPDFRVLGLADSPAATLASCASAQPDVLVLGLLAGWPRDPSPARSLRAASPATRVLALAPHARDRCAHLNPIDDAPRDGDAPPWMRRSTCLPRALARGAHGAINGDAAAETLFAAVRALARGERWPAAPPPRARGRGASLSPRETKVARLVARGASNKEIGDSLSISDLTVKKHLGHIFRKLDVHDRLQLGLCIARNPAVLDGEEDSAEG